MKSKQIKVMAVTAILMAFNIVLSSFGVPVPGGHMYLNDVIICTAAILWQGRRGVGTILLNPFGAFMVGGVGAFIGDLLFYPTPMFVSLVTHGLQAVVISLATRRLGKDRPSGSAIGVTIGAVIMVVGYSLGRAFIYSTPEYALLKLPFQIAQAVVGAVVGWLLCWKCKIAELYEKRFGIMS